MKKKILKNTMLVALGFILGIGGSFWYYLHKNKQTEVWTSKSDLSLENGIVIPRNTDLILDSYMSEGFASLTLFVNADAISWEQFERRIEDKPFLSIPYWITVEDSKNFD